MTPKEKANEFFYKIYDSKDYNGYCNGCCLVFEQAKDIALIAIDEIMHYLEIVLGVDKEDFEYWQEVKEEIEKL